MSALTNEIILGLNSYKLAQFVETWLKEHRSVSEQEDGKEIEEAINSVSYTEEENSEEVRVKGIRARTARKWLNKLGFSWKDVKKGVFIDGHEREDVVEDRHSFLKLMKDLSAYIVDFKADGSMEEKDYPSDCIVGGSDRRPIIVITHDESIFSANDGKRQAWIRDGDAILRPKGKGKGIMVSDFLLPFSRLNLLSLSAERQKELMISGVPSEAVVYFEYGQEEGYWEGDHLLRQVKERALPIAMSLYPGYQFLFLFDNATSHAVYSEDALRVRKMNKGIGGKQPFLRDGWFDKEGQRQLQSMTFLGPDSLPEIIVPVQKGVQMVLEERGLWPTKGLNLVCPTPECTNCQAMAKCKACIKGSRCSSCLEKKVHSDKCTVKRACDECRRRKERCECVAKQYCPRCASRIGKKCLDCEELPPKCTSNGK